MRLNRSLGLTALAVAMAQMASPISTGAAADLTVSHRHYGYSRVVADYDGTPVVIRPGARSAFISDHFGGAVLVDQLENVYPTLNIDNPTYAGSPTRYFNGERIRP